MIVNILCYVIINNNIPFKQHKDIFLIIRLKILNSKNWNNPNIEITQNPKTTNSKTTYNLIQINVREEYLLR
jgi:hypothetical protein